MAIKTCSLFGGGPGLSTGAERCREAATLTTSYLRCESSHDLRQGMIIPGSVGHGQASDYAEPSASISGVS